MTVSCSVWRFRALGYRPITLLSLVSLVGNDMYTSLHSLFHARAIVPEYPGNSNLDLLTTQEYAQKTYSWRAGAFVKGTPQLSGTLTGYRAYPEDMRIQHIISLMISERSTRLVLTRGRGR